MKKLISMVLLAAMMAALVSGCGGDGGKADETYGGKIPSGTASDKKVADGKTAAAEGDEEPYEIIIELIGAGTAQEGTAEVEAAINEITLPAINCTVKFRELAISDHATQLGLLGTDGDRLDIIFVGYTTSMQTNVANGLLLPLNEYLDVYAPEMVAKAGKLMDACKIGDEIYCVPGNYYPAVTPMLTWDIETAEKLGFKCPENPEWSYDYLEKLYEAVKASGFDGYGFCAGDGVGVNITGYNMEKFGTSMMADGIYGCLPDMTKDTEIKNIFETPEYLNEVKKRREWVEKGYMMPDSLTNGTTMVAAMMARQILAGVAQGNATYVLSNKNLLGYEQGSEICGEAVYTGSSIPEYGLGVTVTSERPDKCVQLLNLIMTNADLANIMNYGVEGVHYVKVSDRIIDYPEGVDWSNAKWGAQIVSYGDSAEIYHRAPYTEEWYDTLAPYSAEEATPSIAFGYVFDTSSVKTQVAAVSSVVGEYNPGLMCGMVEDVDARVAEFIVKLEAAGINDIIAENQRQFDQWRAAKGK